MSLDTATDSRYTETVPKRKLILGKAFTDVHCKKCNALLFREIRKSNDQDRLVEIKCRRCGELNVS